jgi:hypothetical protein
LIGVIGIRGILSLAFSEFIRGRSARGSQQAVTWDEKIAAGHFTCR